jgi:hypothetical protein
VNWIAHDEGIAGFAMVKLQSQCGDMHGACTPTMRFGTSYVHLPRRAWCRTRAGGLVRVGADSRQMFIRYSRPVGRRQKATFERWMKDRAAFAGRLTIDLAGHVNWLKQAEPGSSASVHQSPTQRRRELPLSTLNGLSGLPKAVIQLVRKRAGFR